jgi:tetratricopeptide (TPR) repeat protein
VSRSAVDQAYTLLQQGRLQDALAIIEPWATLPKPDHPTLSAYAVVLRNLGRVEQAVEINRLCAERFPGSGVAWHNLASILKDEGRDREAVEASERAFAAGLDAPEAWIVWARAHQGMGELDAAEDGYRRAVERRTDDEYAIRDLAQLVWMRTEDPEAAAAVFDASALTPVQIDQKAKIFKFAGLSDRALDVIECALPDAPDNAMLLQSAVQYAMESGRFNRALVYAQHNLRRLPDDIGAVEVWASANLAAGKVDEALMAARKAVKANPLGQASLAIMAACARAAGAPEYEELYNYAEFVRPSQISAPPGWPTPEAYLADLKAALDELHIFKTHPIDQSLRHGSQTMNDIRQYDHPALKAFFPAIEPLIRNYMDAVGEGDDPLRQRNTRSYDIAGAWSVRLRPCGFHVDHIHTQGWLSSAFYVETPKSALDRSDREGWIKFGVPGLPLPEKPEPAHYVRPEPGRLVLFPSYMWHGTVPFTTEESRMTIAFDVVPAAPKS